jgi:glycerophosphoryl diester phosphodiesterase
MKILNLSFFANVFLNTFCSGVAGNLSHQNSIDLPSGKSIALVGHRGNQSLAGENTLTSFQHALEEGVWGVEIDIRRCKSGELVVIHDEVVDRVSNGQGFVRDLTLEQLKALTFCKNDRIATFEEVLDLLDGKVNTVLDIKDRDISEQVAQVVQKHLAKGSWKFEQLYATGFEHRALVELATWLLGIKLVPAIVATPWNLAQQAVDMNAHGVCFIDLDSLMSPDVMADARARGLSIWVCVPIKEKLRRVLTLDIDVLMVDWPAYVKEVCLGNDQYVDASR